MKTLEEIVKDVLYEAHKLSNGQPSIATIERMNATSKRLAKDLDEYVNIKSTEKLKVFQERIVDAFKAVESELERIKTYMANSHDPRLNKINRVDE